jgi:hypothetical protein
MKVIYSINILIFYFIKEFRINSTNVKEFRINSTNVKEFRINSTNVKEFRINSTNVKEFNILHHYFLHNIQNRHLILYFYI